MWIDENPEVLISGAGPVGLATALALVDDGLRVEIVDAAGGLPTGLWTSILHPDVVAWLEQMHVGLSAHTCRIDKVAVYDGDERVTELHLAQSPEQPAAIVIDVDELLASLHDRLSLLEMEVAWYRRVSHIDPRGDHVRIELDVLTVDSEGYGFPVRAELVDHHEHIVADTLIAADGPDSFARRHLGLELVPQGDARLWARFEIAGGGELDGEMRINVGTPDTATAWPLPRGGLRLDFDLSTDESGLADVARAGAAVGEQQLHALASRHLPWLHVGNRELFKASVELIQPAVASRLIHTRTCLAGAAAARLDERASRSLNHGLREARSVASAMHRLLRDNDANALADYEHRERRRIRAEVEGSTIAGPGSGVIHRVTAAMPFERR